MKTRIIVVIGLAAAVSTGCAIYDGAIYSSYQQTDISIRSQPETATPVKLNFGHEQSVVSFVPHRDDRNNGEAVSVFGWTNTESITVADVLTAAQANVTAAKEAAAAAAKAAAEANDSAKAATAAAAENTPATTQGAAAAADVTVKKANAAAEEAKKAVETAETTKKASTQSGAFDGNTGGLLRAQGRFATGNAAKVLVIPQGTTVVVQKSVGDEKPLTLTLDANPVDRMAVLFPKLTQQTHRDVTEEIKTCSNGEDVYGDAANRVDSCFLSKLPTDYNLTHAKRFSIGYQTYLYAEECPGTREEKRTKVNQALEHSFENICRKSL